jgi:FAD/FMN-containing dehydrogenase
MWLNFAMAWDDPANDEDFMERSRAIVRDLQPWVGKGVYLNMLNVDELDRVVEAFGREKYERLGRIKAEYDPANLFRTGYPITPAS